MDLHTCTSAEDTPTLVLPMRTSRDPAARVLRCAQRVHRALGPGLVDCFYARALAQELSAEAIPYQRDAFVEVRYRAQCLGKRQVGFLLEAVAVDLCCDWPVDFALMRVRAASLLSARPTGLVLHFGGATLQASRADAPVNGDPSTRRTR